jgi:hypothetical protein
VKSQAAMEQETFPKLRDAVRKLYYAAHWTPDRPVDAAKLWTDVRDAAGFPKGGAPTELPFDGIRAFYSVDRLRQIGHLASAKKGREFGTSETRALILLYGQELQDSIDTAVRKFIEEKLS